MKYRSVFEFINAAIAFGKHGDDVENLQNSLVSLGFKLPVYGVDGIFEYETLGASKRALEVISRLSGAELTPISNYLTAEQIDTINKAASDPELSKKIKDLVMTTTPTPGDSGDLIFSDLIAQESDAAKSFTAKVKDVGQKLQIDPNWLVAVMYKESRLKPYARNKHTGATGLIQFMPATATELGTSVDDLSKMSAVNQMDYVYSYFKHFAGRMQSYSDVYLVTFYPKAVGKSDDYVIGSETSDAWAKKIAAQNPAISSGKDYITKKDFGDYLLKDLPAEYAAKLA